MAADRKETDIVDDLEYTTPSTQQFNEGEDLRDVETRDWDNESEDHHNEPLIDKDGDKLQPMSIVSNFSEEGSPYVTLSIVVKFTSVLAFFVVMFNLIPLPYFIFSAIQVNNKIGTVLQTIALVSGVCLLMLMLFGGIFGAMSTVRAMPGRVDKARHFRAIAIFVMMAISFQTTVSCVVHYIVAWPTDTTVNIITTSVMVIILLLDVICTVIFTRIAFSNVTMIEAQEQD